MFLVTSFTSFTGILTNRSFISYVINLQYLFMGNSVNSVARSAEFVTLYWFLKFMCVCVY